MPKTRKGSSRKKGGYTRKRGGGFFKKNSWFWNKRKINVNGKNWNQMNDDAKRVYCWNHYKGSSKEKPGYHYVYDSDNDKCAMLEFPADYGKAPDIKGRLPSRIHPNNNANLLGYPYDRLKSTVETSS